MLYILSVEKLDVLTMGACVINFWIQVICHLKRYSKPIKWEPWCVCKFCSKG